MIPMSKSQEHIQRNNLCSIKAGVLLTNSRAKIGLMKIPEKQSIFQLKDIAGFNTAYNNIIPVSYSIIDHLTGK
jgi:hypothetical protein